MKKILIIAYYYPPKGGAGVQRTTKFANYLNKFGYDVHVLTVKKTSSGLVDLSLQEDINTNISVYRTDIKETNLLNNVLKIANKTVEPSAPIVKKDKFNAMADKLKKVAKDSFLSLYSLRFIPDDKKGWIPFAVEQARKIIAEKNIDIIYTTSAPYSAHLIGLKLKNEFNLKWIADFRDPWASNPFSDYNFLIQNIYNHLEAKVVKSADRVISVSTPIIEDFIKRYPKEDKNKFVTIPNGYDERDFEKLNINASQGNTRFTILYNGTLYGKRSPEKLLAALDKLISLGAIDDKKIQLRFIGEIGSSYMGIVNFYKNKYKDIIIHKPYIPHSESLKELCGANALLLIIDEGKGSEGIYTGKIFEYIRTGKTILGLVPDGVAKDLIKETNTGYTAAPSSQKDIEYILTKAYNDYISDSNRIKPNFDIIQSYSRENLTKKLIEEINKII